MSLIFVDARTIDYQMNAIASGGKHVMLQWRWSVIRVNYVTRLFMKMGDPFDELSSIRDCRGQKDVVHIVGQQNQRFFPNDTSLFVSHVMNFIENHPTNFSHDLNAKK